MHIWDKLGLLNRELLLYKKLTLKGINFKFLTYGNEKDLVYKNLNQNFSFLPIHTLIKSKIKILYLIKSFILPFKLKSTIRDCNIIKSNQMEGSWVGFLAKIFFRKKFIVRGGYEWLSNFSENAQKKGLSNFFKYLLNYSFIFIIELLSYKIADRIILTSQRDINYITKIFRLKKKKIYLIPNFINIDLFKPKDLPKKNKALLFVGRLSREKNLINLLKSMIDLEDYKLDIIGKGPFEDYIVKFTKLHNLNVNLLGIVPNENLPDYYNQYEIFILPSLFECNPKVLLEAMSCGIPCIATNVRGINEIIDHEENGYLCGINSKSIKNAIETLYSDMALRQKISKNSRKTILDNYTLEKVLEKEFDLYKELFKKKFKNY